MSRKLKKALELKPTIKYDTYIAIEMDKKFDTFQI